MGGRGGGSEAIRADPEATPETMMCGDSVINYCHCRGVVDLSAIIDPDLYVY
jgi:hypothetical protein